MTPQIDEYFGGKRPVRKKEPQYLAFINKNSCTSCGACATMCPVDCIFEYQDSPGQSYHQIDFARCIGCQMCYRVPSESTGPWTMEICPWNAIDLTYNPCFKEVKEWDEIWRPYYVGADEAPDFRQLEELGYQLFLNRMVYVPKGSELEKYVSSFAKPTWSYGEGEFAILEPVEDCGSYQKFVCTTTGDELVDFLYRDYEHMFLD